MAFLLQRYLCTGRFTYGRFYHGEAYLCDTMEGEDLRLEDDIFNAASIVYGRMADKTAMPRGRYLISNCYLNRYGMRVPCIYGVDSGFDCLVITDSSDFDLGCVCVGTYDYGERGFVPSREPLQRIVGILDDEVEARLVVK